MRFLNRFSIRNKLILVFLMVTVVTLIIGFSVVVIKDIRMFKKDMVDSTTMSARLIGWSCISALAFEDRQGVQDILTRAELMPAIVSVYVFDHKGSTFGALEKEEATPAKPVLYKDGYSRFEKGYLHTGLPITYQARQYGTIYLRASTAPLEKKIKEYLLTMAGLMILLVAVSYLLASGFQRLISQPILRLAALTKRVSREADYSIRATIKSEDEIGVLYDGFNNMLGQIHQRQTAREKAEMELKRHRDHLEELVKERTTELAVAKEAAETANSAKSDFLAQMSHEIRTPLNAVTGLTHIVLKSDLTLEQRDYLEKVQVAGGNLLTVINDILDFSKVEAGRLALEPRSFDLNRLMEKLADLFSDQVAKKDLELIFALDAHVPGHLIGDDARLIQILTNLISNAVKFTPAGEIIVRVKADPAGSPLDVQPITFEVSDTGIGIDPKVLPALFDPFTQADSSLTRNHEGTGLGLAICRRLVELMDGTIEAHSTPGQGSLFSFTVMLACPEKSGKSEHLPEDLKGLKALVADDSPTACQVLADLLESLRFNVSTVESGEQAIAALQQSIDNDPFRLVIMDWKMPGIDGIEAAKCIRDLDPEASQPFNSNRCPTIIILVTAYGHQIIRGRRDTAAVDAWLSKPVKPSQLLDTIMALMHPSRTAPSQRSSEDSPMLNHQLTGRRVLVVEDSELNREVAVALIKEAGLIVETAENGQIALELVARSDKGRYAAVLMDIQMPVMDGYTATRQIRIMEDNAQSPGKRLPIIALTAHALKGEKEKCIAAGMNDYLAKPIDELELLNMLLKWIPAR